VVDFAPARRRAAGCFDAQAEQRHGRLFADPLGFLKSPAGFRAEDVIGESDLEGFVSGENVPRRRVQRRAEPLARQSLRGAVALLSLCA
jgi:hypothetical protein